MKSLLISLVIVFPSITWGSGITPDSHGLNGGNLLKHPAASRTEIPTYKDLSLYDGLAVAQEATDWDAGIFVLPNELLSFLFEICLPREGGVYVSVGTFRGLNVASSGRTSHVVLMDYDRGIVVFNKVNLELIARAKDRFDYLSLLFTGEHSSHHTGTTVDFINDLTPTAHLVSKWEHLGIEMPKEDSNLLKGNAIDDTILELPQTMKKFVTVNSMNKTFWGDDQRFRTIKRMILEKKVTVLTGDLLKRGTLASLAKRLKQKNEKVSAFDFSNVGFDNPKQIPTIISNIEQLPYQDGAKLLFTAQMPADGHQIPEDWWNYYAFSKRSAGKLRSLAQKTGKWQLNVDSYTRSAGGEGPWQQRLRTPPGEECGK